MLTTQNLLQSLAEALGQVLALGAAGWLAYRLLKLTHSENRSRR